MGACSVTAKSVLIILSLIFWAAAAGLFYLGSYIFVTYKHYDDLADQKYTLVPAVITLAAGVFMFLVGLLGCIAACKEHKCLLATFFSLILVILVAEVVSGTLAYVYRADVSDALKDGFDAVMKNYTNDATYRDEMDYVQDQLMCCGRHNYTDWERFEFYRQNHSVPESCCKDKNNCTTKISGYVDNPYIYEEGCYDKLEDLLRDSLAVLAVVAIIFAVILVIGLICSCVLFCRSGEVPYLTLQGSGQGYRV
ncbi:tetraspanin-3 [Lingula anatina]|uniref:Tetraspanin n=1 Tax=Lingula anatina TaxID=7574 RepID=A0A1S3JM91_LINAN|nr:tetraspanin-3 [Lingula anatina]|eukprot:XP_013411492.1 tetraspanin-3 [Lingula anatina]